jgi:hypothetical protein
VAVTLNPTCCGCFGDEAVPLSFPLLCLLVDAAGERFGFRILSEVILPSLSKSDRGRDVDASACAVVPLTRRELLSEPVDLVDNLRLAALGPLFSLRETSTGKEVCRSP